MLEDKKRHLAAIMFTDIVGYTAMMQSNQELAMTVLKQFEVVLKTRIAENGGVLIQTYGDGSLSIFDSTTSAVRCAKEIQEEIRGKVPLRIGIHQGEITRDGEHTFGDGVNIASRIESMGVAGAVLLSSSVRHQVKNMPAFDLTSLGKFSFKNVAEPMTVYALANEGFTVPKSAEMKGKGKQSLNQRFLFRMASIGFGAMVVGAAIFWAAGTRNPGASQLLPESIREETVAVSVFENFTGDTDLDALGYLASEWISSGLRELNVRTVSSEMVRQHKDQIGILPDNLDGNPSFAEITGAKYVITGSYFLNGDSLVLNTRLNSTETGNVLKSFEKLTAHKEQKERLVEKARQYLMGYWVLKSEKVLPKGSKANSPTYEAYQAFLKCKYNKPYCYQKVIEMDPDFLMVRLLMLGASLIGLENDSLFYVNKQFVQERLDHCSEYEKNYFEWITASWDGNTELALEAGNKVYQLDSNNYMTLHQTALGDWLVNRNDKAIKKYGRIFEKITFFGDQINEYSFRQYIDALVRVKAYDKALAFYTGLSERMKQRAGTHTVYGFIQALLYEDKIEEVIQLIHNRGNQKEEYLRAAYMFRYIYPDSARNPFFKSIRAQIDQFSNEKKEYVNWPTMSRLINWESSATAYYVLGDWDKAEESLLHRTDILQAEFHQPYKGFPEPRYWEKLWHTALLGCVYAQQNKVALYEAQLRSLDQLGSLDVSQHAIFNRGTVPYLKARIYAILGEKERAVEMLKTSLNMGRVFFHEVFTLDLDFINIKDYPPFEELIRSPSF